jgi:hypothetical protein
MHDDAYDYEKLGLFYLGRPLDEAGQPLDAPLLYDARDLVTHALCVGMTGSGKTGLCLALLEEAAIDGIPAIAIDPKGDLGNLLLAFPELRGEDFRPWIEESDAARAGRTPDEHAAATAELWRKGLAESGQPPERIARFRDACEVAIYTPGSSAGLSLSLLKSFTPPPVSTSSDPDLLRERVLGTVSGLLGLLGIEADPIQSREHILFSLLFERAWSEGCALTLADLVRAVQTPPLERVGVLDLESFFPSRERAALALRLNNLLASPGFQSWMQGEALDVQKLLWTPAGKPRIAILSIAHLSDAERMFFVTLVLEELVAWMRTQSGTSSLRALFYMDEIFGYFPPTANPPAKTPLLTLLKQGRAFGLGCVLATQNPVDLDYKGLANCGTWFLGRLQTERDKLRVLDGLEGASASSGAAFDRAAMERTLAGLAKRTFLLHNVHEEHPQLFQTRWALSYLRGPLTKSQIASLMAPRKAPAPSASPAPAPRAGIATAPVAVPASAVPSPAAQAAAPAPSSPSDSPSTARPPLPAGVVELFLQPVHAGAVRYAPALLGEARVHFVDAKRGVDTWQSLAVLAPLARDGGNPWEAASDFDELDAFAREPASGAGFDPLPPEAQRAKTYDSWARSLALHLYGTRSLALLACPALKLVSRAGEPRADFLARVRLAAREQRDRALGKLKTKYAPKVASANDAIRRAEERVRRESSQYEQQKSQSMISVGATLLGALFGRKTASAANVGRAATAARGFSRAAREKDDIESADQALRAAKEELIQLEFAFQKDAEQLGTLPEPEALGLLDVTIQPRKADTVVERVALVWVPG